MRHMVVWTTLITLVTLSRTMDNTETEKWESISQVPYYCESKDENNTDIHCYGSLLVDIPSNLNEFLVKLSVTDANIIYIKRNSMERYRNSIRDITLSNLPNLRVIEEGTFRNMPNLRTIYISHAPELKFLHGFLRGVTSSTFYSLLWPGSNYLEDLLGDVPLATVRPFEGCGCNMMVLHLTMPFRRIIWTGLLEVPDLYFLPKNNTMFLLDLDHNRIKQLLSNSIKITAQQVTLNFNDITCIDDNAFNGSQIAELYIRSNIRLGELGQNAFKGLKSLRMLDLSETAIKGLPVEGLRELEILKIEKTHTMQTIPSIYDLRNLKEAKLTHSFHCCAFRYPEHHNPEKHAQYEENMKNICKELGQSRGQFIIKSRKRRYIHSKEAIYSSYIPLNNLETEKIINLSEVHPLIAAGYENSDKSFLIPLRGKTIEQFKETPNDFIAEDDGFFHPHPVKINESQLDAICGKIVFKIPEVDCSPEPNALNPCEDIMGSAWLRMSVWCVLTLALLGNLSVIIVVIFGESDINVSRFLICNLAFADFCMGLYLLLTASMDYHSVGEYFNYAYNWQYGLGCQIAGFLTVFSTHLSVFTLAVVTLERWFTITYAIYLTKRITLKSAIKILVGGWIYSVLVAMLPALGISNYSSTSICLPMEADKVIDKAYLYFMIVINGLAFAFIVICYIQIYMSLGYETRQISVKGEMTIAKKMALLVFTDFATLAPISFFGLTALAGYPLIGVTRSKILLVFFYPLNACANPYLYGLLTAQYRRDLSILVSRCGMCKKRAERYKLSDSIPVSNPPPLLPKRSSCNGNSGKSTATKDTKIESSYV